MTEIRTILCPVDFSPLSDREVRMASQLCERLGARLYLQHTMTARPPEGLGMTWMYAEEHERHDRQEEAETAARLRQLAGGLPAGVKTQAVVAWGPFERMLHELAAALPADLIVIGTHGRSTSAHRSVTERMILDAPCPVLTTRDESPDSLLPDFAARSEEAPIVTLVPVDLSDHSLRALDYAFALSRRLPLRLHVRHVTEAGNGAPEEVVHSLRRRIPADLAERVDVDVRADRTVDGILRCEAELEARLMIMGSHHHGLLRRLLGGSTAREMLHASPCPVWFVPEGARAA